MTQYRKVEIFDVQSNDLKGKTKTQWNNFCIVEVCVFHSCLHFRFRRLYFENDISPFDNH